MRPPMQKSALQQNEANRLQQQQSVHLITHQKHLHHQQQQQQHQQQQQLQLPLQTVANSTTTTNVLLANKCKDNINDLQQHHQQQQQLQQHHNTDSIITTTATPTISTTVGRKSKLEQRELLVENHLNNACFAAQVHHHHHPHQSPSLLQHQQQLSTTATAPSLPSLPVYYNDYYEQPPQQHQQPTQRQPRPTTLLNRRSNNQFDDNCSGVKLLDLISTSPPSQDESGSLFRTPATADVLLHNRQVNYAANNTTNSSSSVSATNTTSRNNSQEQRYSYTSQYSRSSSSDDSSSLSLSTACGSLPIGPGSGSGPATRNSGLFSSYNNTFDDAAENFIINFPADTTPASSLSSSATTTAAAATYATSNTNTTSVLPTSHSEFYNYCLPLSETEPLLTNIEATIKDKQRSIYLNKNSASLIFTKKDLSAHSTLGATSNSSTPTATYQQHQQQQQQFKLQSKTNNNFNGASGGNISSSNSSGLRRVPAPPLGQHSTLRSFSEENYRRKPTKHLPATYHQQHRRSLQLNYNNNLVTTSTCGVLANNNHHHHCCNTATGSGGNNQTANRNSTTQAGSYTNSAVLHKTHHNNHNYPQQQLQQQHQQSATLQSKVQQQQNSSAYNNPSSLANNTAAATRKQYAYSWYAPVYSALEEELEHDSRDSSPIHNLANTKKQNLHQYHHRPHDLNSSLTTTASGPATDTEREALLETRNNINIQAHLAGPVVNPLKRDTITKQLNPSKLALQHTRNSSAKGSLQGVKGLGLGLNGGGGGDIAAVEGFSSNYDLEGPHAGSLGLAGGPQPRRIRFGNFLKSLVGLRPSVTQRNGNGGESVPQTNGMGGGGGVEFESGHVAQIPSSPEITITRTPSEQNMVVMRDPNGRQDYNVVYSSREKLANGDRVIQAGGSTSSLNVMQQKLWNIMRREGSAISLHQEKSQSIVHYTGLRKCETVIALTRQTSSPCSPTMAGGGGAGGAMCPAQQRLSHTGSGIFSASGVEQIRPLNRLRNSVSSMNNTCSRCSSLLSLAASSSRYSLNSATANPHPMHQHQHYHPHQHHQQQHQYPHQTATSHFSQYQRNPSIVSSSNLSNTYSQSREGSLEAGLQFAVKRNSRTSSCSITNNSTAVGSQRNSSSTAASSSRTPSLTSPTTTTATNTTTTASTVKLTPPPTENLLTPPSLTFGPSTEKTVSAPLTVTSHFKMLTMKMETQHGNGSGTTTATNINDHGSLDAGDDGNEAAAASAGDVIDGVPSNKSSSNMTTELLGNASTNVTPSTSANALLAVSIGGAGVGAIGAASASIPEESITTTILQCNADTITSTTTTTFTSSRPFELFTCKLCLIDVEDASNSTILHQCGCQFCTECMKAYVEFEISEGAYDISCPDAQCPEQGAMTLPEIAMLTTTNLMKKHHRYRLNREIELDKTRTWCPRAGCETVCLIGSTISSAQTDVAPSTSSSAAAASTNASSSSSTAISPSGGGAGLVAGGGSTDVPNSNTPLLCAVLCPSCKDEFCSACKKTWHPNITCEEHSRRLAADGQDDIGIPFDNDLIKCCPMCAVPIEKDEGCAQMMCKRCKHVFCWYCLASLDDDFLLRHYDKGPCKNKLGHSRASVVWHRAQVIGIFAGFGILLLVASPLLLLAAPCIICCKCRSCSGSKLDEGDVDMDEATALQSLN